jgi:sortase B
VDNTNIDYPVVQGSDNEFYLSKYLYKNNLLSGSIFMDYRNDFDRDENVIIYGHNMRNKTMFSELEKFKEEDFFYKDNKI